MYAQGKTGCYFQLEHTCYAGMHYSYIVCLCIHAHVHRCAEVSKRTHSFTEYPYSCSTVPGCGMCGTNNSCIPRTEIVTCTLIIVFMSINIKVSIILKNYYNMLWLQNFPYSSRQTNRLNNIHMHSVNVVSLRVNSTIKTVHVHIEPPPSTVRLKPTATLYNSGCIESTNTALRLLS